MEKEKRVVNKGDSLYNDKLSAFNQDIEIGKLDISLIETYNVDDTPIELYSYNGTPYIYTKDYFKLMNARLNGAYATFKDYLKFPDIIVTNLRSGGSILISLAGAEKCVSNTDFVKKYQNEKSNAYSIFSKIVNKEFPVYYCDNKQEDFVNLFDIIMKILSEKLSFVTQPILIGIAEEIQKACETYIQESNDNQTQQEFLKSFMEDILIPQVNLYKEGKFMIQKEENNTPKEDKEEKTSEYKYDDEVIDRFVENAVDLIAKVTDQNIMPRDALRNSLYDLTEEYTGHRLKEYRKTFEATTNSEISAINYYRRLGIVPILAALIYGDSFYKRRLCNVLSENDYHRQVNLAVYNTFGNRKSLTITAKQEIRELLTKDSAIALSNLNKEFGNSKIVVSNVSTVDEFRMFDAF